MKKLFTLGLLSFCFLKSNSQNLLTEDFNYTTTDLSTNGWSIHSGTSDIIGTTTGLTYTGYAAAGNAANVIGAGDDYNLPLSTSQTTNGTVIYTSLLLKFTETGTTALAGSYFFHLGNRTSATSFTSFCGRLWSKMDATGNISIGASNASTATYATGTYALNTTYLVILKYTLNTAGNDELLVWIKSAGTPATEAAAGTPDISLTAELGQDVVNAVALRQTTGVPDVVVDGIRVGNTWATSVLPVTLSSLSASLINNQPQINWTTSTEVNFDYFGVEKSLNAQDFIEIGKVNSNKAANGSTYQFADITKTLSNQFYRLKMVDNDGTFKYSSVVAVNGKSSLQLAVYPNPVANTIILSHPKASAGASLQIIGIDGRKLATQIVETGATQTSMDATKLVKGNYFVSFVNNGVASTTQLVKQ
ncbi:MAG: T9SS type A sorting domain-containing protein [Deinococcales bacterium]|nr:T9SS type A sorting domain-containing protein [Chitinophagaceae bacterium]